MPKYYLTRIEGNYAVICSPNTDIILKNLLKWVAFDKHHFSYTREPDGSASIILRYGSTEELELIQRDCNGFLQSLGEYSCISISTDIPLFGEVGMLAEVSKFFVTVEIPILCLSTYKCNYIYYPSKFEEILQKSVDNNPDYFFE